MNSPNYTRFVILVIMVIIMTAYAAPLPIRGTLTRVDEIDESIVPTTTWFPRGSDLRLDLTDNGTGPLVGCAFTIFPDNGAPNNGLGAPRLLAESSGTFTTSFSVPTTQTGSLVIACVATTDTLIQTNPNGVFTTTVTIHAECIAPAPRRDFGGPAAGTPLDGCGYGTCNRLSGICQCPTGSYMYHPNPFPGAVRSCVSIPPVWYFGTNEFTPFINGRPGSSNNNPILFMFHPPEQLIQQNIILHKASHPIRFLGGKFKRSYTPVTFSGPQVQPDKYRFELMNSDGATLHTRAHGLWRMLWYIPELRMGWASPAPYSLGRFCFVDVGSPTAGLTQGVIDVCNEKVMAPSDPAMICRWDMCSCPPHTRPDDNCFNGQDNILKTSTPPCVCDRPAFVMPTITMSVVTSPSPLVTTRSFAPHDLTQGPPIATIRAGTTVQFNWASIAPRPADAPDLQGLMQVMFEFVHRAPAHLTNHTETRQLYTPATAAAVANGGSSPLLTIAVPPTAVKMTIHYHFDWDAPHNSFNSFNNVFSMTVTHPIRDQTGIAVDPATDLPPTNAGADRCPDLRPNSHADDATVFGSFTCVCNDGYTLHPVAKTCEPFAARSVSFFHRDTTAAAPSPVLVPLNQDLYYVHIPAEISVQVDPTPVSGPRAKYTFTVTPLNSNSTPPGGPAEPPPESITATVERDSIHKAIVLTRTGTFRLTGTVNDPSRPNAPTATPSSGIFVALAQCRTLDAQQTDLCGDHGTCSDEENLCICDSGWYNDHCQTQANPPQVAFAHTATTTATPEQSQSQPFATPISIFERDILHVEVTPQSGALVGNVVVQVVPVGFEVPPPAADGDNGSDGEDSSDPTAPVWTLSRDFDTSPDGSPPSFAIDIDLVTATLRVPLNQHRYYAVKVIFTIPHLAEETDFSPTVALYPACYGPEDDDNDDTNSHVDPVHNTPIWTNWCQNGHCNDENPENTVCDCDPNWFGPSCNEKPTAPAVVFFQGTPPPADTSTGAATPIPPSSLLALNDDLPVTFTVRLTGIESAAGASAGTALVYLGQETTFDSATGISSSFPSTGQPVPLAILVPPQTVTFSAIGSVDIAVPVDHLGGLIVVVEMTVEGSDTHPDPLPTGPFPVGSTLTPSSSATVLSLAVYPTCWQQSQAVQRGDDRNAHKDWVDSCAPSGVCLPATGTCDCDLGWTGPQCKTEVTKPDTVFMEARPEPLGGNTVIDDDSTYAMYQSGTLLVRITPSWHSSSGTAVVTLHWATDPDLHIFSETVEFTSPGVDEQELTELWVTIDLAQLDLARPEPVPDPESGEVPYQSPFPEVAMTVRYTIVGDRVLAPSNSGVVILYPDCYHPPMDDVLSATWFNSCTNGDCTVTVPEDDSLPPEHTCQCHPDWFGPECLTHPVAPTVQFHIDLVRNDSDLDAATATAQDIGQQQQLTPLPHPEGIVLMVGSAIHITMTPHGEYPARGSAVVTLVRIGDLNHVTEQAIDPAFPAVIPVAPETISFGPDVALTHIIPVRQSGVWKVVVELEVTNEGPGLATHWAKLQSESDDLAAQDDQEDQPPPPSDEPSFNPSATHSAPVFVHPSCSQLSQDGAVWEDVCGEHGTCGEDSCSCTDSYVGPRCNILPAFAAEATFPSIPHSLSFSPTPPAGEQDAEALVVVVDTALEITVTSNIQTQVDITLLAISPATATSPALPQRTIVTVPVINLDASSDIVSLPIPTGIPPTDLFWVQIAQTPALAGVPATTTYSTPFRALPSCMLPPEDSSLLTDSTAWTSVCAPNGTCQLDGSCLCHQGFSGPLCTIRNPANDSVPSTSIWVALFVTLVTTLFATVAFPAH